MNKTKQCIHSKEETKKDNVDKEDNKLICEITNEPADPSHCMSCASFEERKDEEL
jgi:hypothetical protein